jgi:hypothetical protein
MEGKEITMKKANEARFPLDVYIASEMEARDRLAQTLAQKMRAKRYNVCVFSSLFGTPWNTNSRLVAAIYVVARRIANPLKEVRVIDNVTGLHKVF